MRLEKIGQATYGIDYERKLDLTVHRGETKRVRFISPEIRKLIGLHRNQASFWRREIEVRE